MNLKDWANKERGRGLSLARALGVRPPFVSDFITGKKQVPMEQCIPIERFTGGQVTCEEMRPDRASDFAYLRGLDAPAQQTQSQAAPETVAPTDTAYTGPDRRQTINPPPPDLERRAPLAAALAGGV